MGVVLGQEPAQVGAAGGRHRHGVDYDVLECVNDVIDRDRVLESPFHESGGSECHRELDHWLLQAIQRVDRPGRSES